MCKVLLIPLSERQVLLANDTEENRRELTQMSLRTFYAVGGTTPQELTELTTSLRILFDLRFISQNAAQGDDRDTSSPGDARRNREFSGVSAG